MESSGTIAVPSGHTPEGGVLVGADNARRRLILFEDPQCPYCRRFEQVSGDLLDRESAGAVAVEYRMRCFLGIESVRADNALALAAEDGKFDELRRGSSQTSRLGKRETSPSRTWSTWGAERG